MSLGACAARSSTSGCGTVGIIVNPLAGKDIRRLVANASPVSDAAKIGMVRRAVAGAVEGGARRVVIAGDHHHLGRRAIERLDTADAMVEILDEHVIGDRVDTVAAARRLRDEGAGALIVFGGDGTNRDVAAGWPDATLVPVSTGTNNVFPVAWDATSAGTAAALVATGVVTDEPAVRTAKQLRICLSGPSDGEGSATRRRDAAERSDVALVEVALVAGSFVGSRAVWDPDRIVEVVAAIASPASTGLSSIAGRTLPADRWEPAGTHVVLGDGGRRVRLPLSPGSFATVGVRDARRLAPGTTVTLAGPGVIAIDGERSHVLGPGASARVTLCAEGPRVVDVERALHLGALAGCFDAPVARHVPTEPNTSTGPQMPTEPEMEESHVD